MGQNWVLVSQAKGLILGPWTGPSATLDPDAFSASDDSPHPWQLAGDSKERDWEVPGHTLVTITLDSVPLNTQLRKEQPEWPFPGEWRRAALSLAQAQINPAQVRLGRVWSKEARLGSLRGLCQVLRCLCGLGETQMRHGPLLTLGWSRRHPAGA